MNPPFEAVRAIGAKTLIESPFEFALSFIREQSAKRTYSASPLLFFSGLMYLFSPLKASEKARQPIKQHSVFFYCTSYSAASIAILTFLLPLIYILRIKKEMKGGVGGARSPMLPPDKKKI